MRVPRAPLIYTVASTSIATGGTVSNTTIYNPQSSTTQTEYPTVFRIHRCDISVAGGSAPSLNYFVLRLVPQSYSNPSISVTSGLLEIPDPPRVIGYALSDDPAGTGVESPNTTTLNILKRQIVVNVGDSIVLQAVCSVNSSGHTYSALLEYTLATT